jgi:hypothetical protein
VTSTNALRTDDWANPRHLRLGKRGYTEVPRAIFDVADTLECLDLGGNALTALPDDMGRLKKLRVLFCSGNPFERLPPCLGACPGLEQIGFRGCGLRDIPADALPPRLRWLTLTDNHLETLPEALGARPGLQKLMLAGNRLRRLPESLAGASRLELLRLSANRFESLPPWLLDMPRLAWLAFSGNPLDAATPAIAAPLVSWSALEVADLLGEGASGRVHRALWHEAGGGSPTSIAIKLFKGAMTSDGLPDREMAACLAAGPHRNLLGALGRLIDHPEGADGLLMPLTPDGWRVLAGPPSLESCSRDVYDPALALDRAVALRIARGVAAAAAHLHARGLTHGDLYAHNILWDGTKGDAALSDFGAASFTPPRHRDALERLEVLAWGFLLGELLDRCAPGAPADDPARHLEQACVAVTPAARPSFAEVLTTLDAL